MKITPDQLYDEYNLVGQKAHWDAVRHELHRSCFEIYAVHSIHRIQNTAEFGNIVIQRYL